MTIKSRTDITVPNDLIREIRVSDGTKGQKLVNKIISECGRYWPYLDLKRQNFERGSLNSVTEPNLTLADLTGANFSKCKLNRARMRRVKAVGVNFSEADLFGVDFAEADLTGANLRGAKLTYVHWGRANLTGADLTGAIFDYDSPLGAQHLTTVKSERIAQLNIPNEDGLACAVFVANEKQRHLIIVGNSATDLANLERDVDHGFSTLGTTSLPLERLIAEAQKKIDELQPLLKGAQS